jgi:hypothetical protein
MSDAQKKQNDLQAKINAAKQKELPFTPPPGARDLNWNIKDRHWEYIDTDGEKVAVFITCSI